MFLPHFFTPEKRVRFYTAASTTWWRVLAWYFRLHLYQDGIGFYRATVGRFSFSGATEHEAVSIAIRYIWDQCQ